MQIRVYFCSSSVILPLPPCGHILHIRLASEAGQRVSPCFKVSAFVFSPRLKQKESQMLFVEVLHCARRWVRRTDALENRKTGKQKVSP